jgi:ATP-dependent Clp protease ATP-binding subunit ClpA
MDKFLQILEDGRMTDGQGNTVYFSETLIFFTSNAGISEEVCDVHGRVVERRTIVAPDSSYEEIQEKVEVALKTKFKPEVINRIGKNIIVFNYITEAATGEILNKQLENIVQGISRKNKIRIVIDDSTVQHLIIKCLEKDTRENGGRGIGNVVESEFINPMSEYIFDSAIQPEETIKVICSVGKLAFERCN